MIEKWFWRDLIVLDFDNMIYYNPDNNFSSVIDENRVKNAASFYFDLINQGNFTSVYDPFVVLISGRSYLQEQQVNDALRKGGYAIDEFHFFVPNRFSEQKFVHFYVEWKAYVIAYLIKGNIFGRKIVIDDDKQVLTRISGNLRDVETYLAPYEYHQKALCLTFKKANPITSSFEYCHPYYQLIFS